ncbi:MAG TPA: hypothetical protein VKU00_08165 [Chthonomonadaceae bacterium]|nr:hypothetical protein [Chthonomonadaceae bacterium]
MKKRRVSYAVRLLLIFLLLFLMNFMPGILHITGGFVRVYQIGVLIALLRLAWIWERQGCSPKAKRALGWVIFVAALAACVTGILSFGHLSDHALLDRSTQLLSMQQFGAEQEYAYLWQTDQTLLIFRPHTQTGDPLTGNRWDILRRDMQSGISDHLTSLEKRFNDSFFGSQFYPPLRISPNGQWVAWSASGNKYIAATVDGKSSVSLPEEDRDDVYFTNDNLHLIGLVEETPKNPPANTFPSYGVTHVNLRDLENPTAHAVLPIAPSSPLSLNRANLIDVTGAPWVEFTTKAISADNLLYGYGVFDDNRFHDSKPGETVVDLYHLDLTQQGAVTSRTPIRFPHGSWIQEMPFSNDGKRIAFLVHQEYSLPLPRFIRRYLSAFPDERGSRTYLIVSRIDGSERHTIGAVEGESYRLYDLRWLPGDRYLSFLYNDELWKVPSEGFTVE